MSPSRAWPSLPPPSRRERGAQHLATELAAIGEFGFLSSILSPRKHLPDTMLGPGDDCAVVRGRSSAWLLTIDALVEGTHFQLSWQTPFQLGRKSFLVNASDIAAMGGEPRHALVAFAAPPTFPARDLSRIQSGIVAAAGEVGADVVGGNLSRANDLSITIALVGVGGRRIVTRAGARPGDEIYVTGRVGDAALALQWLLGGQKGPRPAAALRRFREPIPRLQAGRVLAESRIASAMIDVSDGLVQDLTHLCEQSSCSAQVEVECVPCPPQLAALRDIAVHGGEDYELLFTVPAKRKAALQRLQSNLGCSVTRIGQMLPKQRGQLVRLLRTDGTPLPLTRQGFDHFRLQTPAVI